MLRYSRLLSGATVRRISARFVDLDRRSNRINEVNIGGVDPNHFGEFSRLPYQAIGNLRLINWSGGHFFSKDSLFVIDEYVPTGLNRREIETKASRILRGQGTSPVVIDSNPI